MEQLIRDGRLKQFLYWPNRHEDQAGSRAQGKNSSKLSLSTINVIFVALRRIGSQPSRVMSVAWPHAEDPNPKSKRARLEVRFALSFSDENKVRTI